MKFIYRILLVTLLGSFSPELFSQGIPIGQWRDDLPYYECISVTEAGSRTYCATPYAVFYFDKEDNSVQRLTKISGLSDISLSVINYNPEYKTLVIAYTNGNVDLVKDNTIINISDIKRASILGLKTINDIFFKDRYAYLSCGFGIVVLDIEKEEIRDTYYIGPDGSQVNVLGLTEDGEDSLYAATAQGIYKAYSKDPNLVNYASWKKDSRIDPDAPYRNITFFSGEVVVSKTAGTGANDTLYRYNGQQWTPWLHDYFNPVMNLESTHDVLLVSLNYFVKYYDLNFDLINTVYSYFPGNPNPRDAIIDKDRIMWIADSISGLISYDMNQDLFRTINLNGPLTALVFSMTISGNDLYVAPGGRDNSYVPMQTPAQIYHFDNTTWNNLNGLSTPELGSALNVCTIAIDPFDGKRMYAGTWGYGLYEFYDFQFVTKYNESNSTLRHHSASTDPNDIRIGGTAFDKDGNLWVVNTHNNDCLSRKSGSDWTGYNIPIVEQSDLGMLLIDSYDQKWIQMRNTTSNSNSILVFSDNGTPDNPGDDLSKKLNTAVGNGNLPGNTVYTMALDKTGEIWVGTENGIGVFYNPENVFSGQNFDAQRPLVQQGAYVQYLMENEMVTAIAVDGANRKWIGTDKGGVFLVSADGTEQILHFTADDSPLFSNRITALAISLVTGEVYIGTDVGIISYKGTATEGGDQMGDVYAYPNPVKEDYAGWIAIKGLVTNAQVRITDVSGNLIYSTRAEGGQAIWDGKSYNGKKAKTGVYLVFAASDDGKEKIVTKILIIN